MEEFPTGPFESFDTSVATYVIIRKEGALGVPKPIPVVKVTLAGDLEKRKLRAQWIANALNHHWSETTDPWV